MAQLNNLIVTGSSRFLNKVYFSNGGTFNGNLNVNNGNINVTNGNLQLYGKVALQGYDNWLRINNTMNNSQPFSYGIYCGISALRTDGELQVGGSGSAFKANGSNVTCGVGLKANKGLNVSGTAIFNNGIAAYNAGLELYFSTPFIDFHFDNSNNDYTSRIIEGNKGVLNINGRIGNCSIENGCTVKNGITLEYGCCISIICELIICFIATLIAVLLPIPESPKIVKLSAPPITPFCKLQYLCFCAAIVHFLFKDLINDKYN